MVSIPGVATKTLPGRILKTGRCDRGFRPETRVEEQPIISALGRERQEDQELKVTLSLRLAWATGDPGAERGRGRRKVGNARCSEPRTLAEIQMSPKVQGQPRLP